MIFYNRILAARPRFRPQYQPWKLVNISTSKLPMLRVASVNKCNLRSNEKQVTTQHNTSLLTLTGKLKIFQNGREIKYLLKMERVTVLDADRRDVVIAERARGSRPFLALSPQRDSNNHL